MAEKRYIVGGKYSLTHQGTKTTKYAYAIIVADNHEHAKNIASEKWGAGCWAIEWSEWREAVEIKNPSALRIYFNT